MELHELRVLKRDAGPESHGSAVPCAGVRRGGREVRPAVSSRGQDGVCGANAMQCAILHVEADDPHTPTVLHKQVQSEVLDEVRGVEGQGTAIQGVEHRVTGAVCRGTAAIGLATLAVVERLSPEGTLVDLACVRAGEGHAVRLQLQHCADSLSAHVVHRVLIG